MSNQNPETLATTCNTISAELSHALQGFAVSVEVATSVLGIGRNAAYRAVRLGDIPSVKIGGRLLIPTAHLRRMLGLEATT